MDWEKRQKDPEFLKRRLRRIERDEEFGERRDKEPEKLLRQINDPAINELLDLLSLGSGPPKISFTNQMPGGGRSRGWYRPFVHDMGLEREISSDIYNFSPDQYYMQRGLNTTKHELTHALDRNMMFHAAANPLSTFTDAYKKLNPGTLSVPGFQEKRQSKDNYESYRYSTDEARAHSVADSYFPKGAPDYVSNAPRHSNATLATEFEVLKDLYKRSFKREK